jgi:hypothetical protein
MCFVSCFACLVFALTLFLSFLTLSDSLPSTKRTLRKQQAYSARNAHLSFFVHDVYYDRLTFHLLLDTLPSTRRTFAEAAGFAFAIKHSRLINTHALLTLTLYLLLDTLLSTKRTSLKQRAFSLLSNTHINTHAFLTLTLYYFVIDTLPSTNRTLRKQQLCLARILRNAIAWGRMRCLQFPVRTDFDDVM